MIQKVSVPVSVAVTYEHKKRQVMPQLILWEGRKHTIKKIGYHHTYRQGKTLFHVFSVESDTLFFKLVHNTDNLSWLVEETADGLPD